MLIKHIAILILKKVHCNMQQYSVFKLTSISCVRMAEKNQDAAKTKSPD